MKFLVSVIALALSFSASATEQTRTSGIYWVPVSKQLSQFSSFDLEEIKVVETAEKVSIEYDLPLELTGAPNKVKFEGAVPASGKLILKSDYGVMECPKAGEFKNCAVSYGGLNFNEQARTELLQSISKSNDELQKRQLVAMSFQHGGEPHGFIRITGK